VGCELRLDDVQDVGVEGVGDLVRLQQSFVKQAIRLGLYEADLINLDFHTIPHYGEQSVLENHWAGSRNKAMTGALTLFAQDAASKLILYTAADIKRDEASDQVLSFLSFWKKQHRGLQPTFIFDSIDIIAATNISNYFFPVRFKIDLCVLFKFTYIALSLDCYLCTYV
jgi:hypothetical protein